MKKLTAFIVVAFIIALSSCNFLDFVTVNPSGQYITKQIKTSAFENVSVSNGFELILTQDSVSNLSIETYENILEHIIVEVDGNTLKIYREAGINFSGNIDVKINLSCNYLNDISCGGGGKVNLSNGWTGDELNISLSGGGEAFGKVQLKSLNLDMSGGSRSEIEGIAENLTINSSGGSRHKHFSLDTKICRADMSGGASAELSVSESLEVYGSGGTNVHYKGDPKLSLHLSGGSSVNKAE